MKWCLPCARVEEHASGDGSRKMVSVVKRCVDDFVCDPWCEFRTSVNRGAKASYFIVFKTSATTRIVPMFGHRDKVINRDLRIEMFRMM